MPKAVRIVAGVFAAVLLIGSHPLFAQAKDSFLGTWQLDVLKSTFTGAPTGGAPTARQLVFEQMKDGLKITTRTVNAQGAVNVTEIMANLDGKDYPAPPNSALDSNSLKRIDVNTLERMGKIDGQVVQTIQYVVSADGKTLTATEKGQVNGINFSSVQVFERE